MESTDANESGGLFRLYLFHSPGTDLYALSANDTPDHIPCPHPSSTWCLRYVVIASGFFSASADLHPLMSRVRNRGYVVLRGDEIPVH
jgi:hypothetical protein